MGSTATLTLVGGGAALLEDCWSFLDHLEQIWSRFLPESDVTRLNWAEGKPVDVDDFTVRLIEEMQAGYARTKGDFDPTLLPDLVRAGYAASRQDPTKSTALPATAVAPGRIDNVAHNGHVVTMPKGTTIDAGGIGKGLAADLVSDFARANGAWGIMAEIAGDIRVSGEAPDGVAWRLGVENPFAAAEHADVVRVPDGGVVTSSQRKRRFGTSREKHHLIDPHTHDSALTSVQTVTVIALTAAIAETLTKPAFVRSTADYLSWLPTQGAAGLVIDDEGNHHESANWSVYR